MNVIRILKIYEKSTEIGMKVPQPVLYLAEHVLFAQIVRVVIIVISFDHSNRSGQTGHCYMRN